jgi:hypothetical protein
MGERSLGRLPHDLNERQITVNGAPERPGSYPPPLHVDGPLTPGAAVHLAILARTRQKELRAVTPGSETCTTS